MIEIKHKDETVNLANKLTGKLNAAGFETRQELFLDSFQQDPEDAPNIALHSDDLPEEAWQQAIEIFHYVLHEMHATVKEVHDK